jgi:hypothetical protein
MVVTGVELHRISHENLGNWFSYIPYFKRNVVRGSNISNCIQHFQDIILFLGRREVFHHNVQQNNEL